MLWRIQKSFKFVYCLCKLSLFDFELGRLRRLGLGLFEFVCVVSCVGRCVLALINIICVSTNILSK